MTSLLLFVLPLMLLFFAMMAVGVMLGRKPLAGSCGGMSAMAGNADCPVCGGNPAKCDATEGGPAPDARAAEAYDAFQKKPD